MVNGKTSCSEAREQSDVNWTSLDAITWTKSMCRRHFQRRIYRFFIEMPFLLPS
jgi:hypothetical protein